MEVIGQTAHHLVAEVFKLGIGHGTAIEGENQLKKARVGRRYRKWKRTGASEGSLEGLGEIKQPRGRFISVSGLSLECSSRVGGRVRQSNRAESRPDSSQTHVLA